MKFRRFFTLLLITSFALSSVVNISLAYRMVRPSSPILNIGHNNLVGVQPSDWVKYGISSKGPLGISLGMAEEDHDWVRIDVQNVSGPFVTFRQTTHFRNGNEIIDTITTDLRTDSADMYIIAINHIVGDRIHVEGSKEVFINGTVSKSYLGVNREAYYSIYSFTAPFFDDWINGTLAYYWDRQTGLLLETNRSAVIIGHESTTLSRWSKEVVDTNLWETNSQPLLSQLTPLTLLGVPIAITIVVTLIKRREKTKRLGN